MLQVNYIRTHKKEVLEGLKKKNFKNLDTLEEVIRQDDERKRLRLQFDTLSAETKTLAERIGKSMKSGGGEDIEPLKARSQAIKEELRSNQEQLAKTESTLEKLLWEIPNVPHIRVPEGTRPEDNLVVLEHGNKPILPKTALPHWELAKKYDLIDFELGNKITGAGFPVYKGKGARLQRALIQFFLDEAGKAGYLEIQPPILVNAASGFGTGQLPDKEGQMYYVVADDLYLIPTAEVPITNIYRDVILDEKELPIKNTGYTPCFRREAGSYGAHVRGLNRLHQFDKVEIVQISHPDHSYAIFEEMVAHVQGLLEALELPYRILNLCGGDMSFTSALTYDLEVFSGAQERWLEVSSVSNFETYQANRLKLRIRTKEGKNQLAHTLNGSALPLPRIVAALLENNQDEEGIQIPKILVPYTKFDRIE
jgi:seryl-tRNA synthetase